MIIKPLKTPPVLAGAMTVDEFLDLAINELHESDIVVVTSKVVSLCEGRTIPVEAADKEQLIYQEADLYCVPTNTADENPYHYTILHNTLIPAAGIDESNGNGNYILWPRDPQASANHIRQYLRRRFGTHHVGVIITDSTIFPSRWGTLGIAISHSGFSAIKNYIGTPDIFGRILHISKANIAGGLAAAAVLSMGEGAECTPIAIIQDAGSVEFRDNDPSPEELAEYYVSPLNDKPFAPFFNNVQWQPGHNHHGASAL